MPSSSKAQQKFMGMVHALQKGDIEPSSVSKSVRDTAKSMKKSDAKDFASTKHKGLPKKVKQEILNKLKEYANKMGRDHLGGDDYTSKRKGGLRDFDGYDNVDYNKDMPMDEAKIPQPIQNLIDDMVKNKIQRRSVRIKSKSGLARFMKDVKPAVKDKLLSIKHNPIDKDELFISLGPKAQKIKESVSPQALKVLNLGLKKINRKFKGASLDGKTIDIELHPGHNRDSEIYQIYDLLKKLKLDKYKTSIFNEATKGDIMRAVKGKSNPYTLVVIKRGDVIYQKDIKNPQEVPAIYSVIRKHMDKGEKIHIEDRTGKIVFKESVEESKGVPQNYMQGRTSDYHTALRGKNKDYSGGTNFKKTNHGQPDIENDDEDQETNQLSNKQIALKAESFKVAGRPVKLNKGKKKNGTDWTVTFKNGKTVPLSDVLSLIKPFPKGIKESFDKVEHLKLLNLALRTMPGYQKQKEIIRKLNKVRVAGGMRPLKETSIVEYGQRLDLSFIEDKEARLDGTPEPKDAIDRDLDEGIMIRRAVDIAQEILPKNTWSKYASDGKKNKEYVKSIVKDLTQLLNRFYKSHDVDMRLKEEVLNEVGLWRIDNYTGKNPGTIVPAKMVATIKTDKDREKKRAVEKDLAGLLNNFWKRWSIPFRIDLSKTRK